MTEDTDDANRQRPFGKPTRREALGAGTAAVLSGFAGCSALDRLFDESDEASPANEDPDESDGNTDGTDGGRAALWGAERERRREIQGEASPSFVPAYEYEPIDVTADDTRSGIDRIVAMPAESTTGDRIVIRCRPDRTAQLAELSALLWADATRIDSYETTVDARSVRFDVFADEDNAVGLGTIEFDDSAELLVARAEDVSEIETVVGTFSDVYDRR